jgi:UDP-3-O-[3-hydroxymyristoyl] glucosamine N-acyltransferase
MEVHKPRFTLADLAALVNGNILCSSGTAADLEITAALPLQDACDGCLTLADSPKHLERIEACPASAVLVGEAIHGCSKPMLVVENIHAAFQAIIGILRPSISFSPAGVAASAEIHPTAKIGLGTTVGGQSTIGANCVIGQRCTIHPGVHMMSGCQFGDDCEIFPGVVVYPGAQVGDRVTIHANATVGAYGFGYKTRNGVHERTSQLGWVEIGNDVEIGTSTAVDRGTYGPTRIGEGTKIDNFVQIAHNCRIGNHNLICAHVGIAGSCSTGDYVVMAGQCGMADHTHLGNRVTVGGQAGVMQDISDGETVFGSPAIDSRRKMREVANTAKLPEMRREFRALQKQVDELTKQLAFNQESTGSAINEVQRKIHAA